MLPIAHLIARLRSNVAPTTTLIALCFRADGCQLASVVIDQHTTLEWGAVHSIARPPSADALTEAIAAHKAEGVVLGGVGAYRTNGRMHFGVRALVSQLVGDPESSHTLLAKPRLPVPVYAWPDAQVNSVKLMMEQVHEAAMGTSSG